MKILQVSKPGAYAPFPVASFVLDAVPSGTRLEDWARKYSEEWASADLFVIDGSFFLLDDDPSKMEGIRLLKILRLLGYRQHCILYSFFSRQDLLAMDTDHSILQSTGTTCLQLPCDLDEKVCADKAGILCEEDIMPFFRAEAVALMDMKRHSLANWWGILRVYDVLQYCGFIGEDVPAEIRKALWRDSSYEGMVMNYFHFHGQKPELSMAENTERSIRSFIKALWRTAPKVVYVDDQADDGWSCLLQTILYGGERPDLFVTPQLPKEGIDLTRLAEDIVSLHPDLVIVDIRLEPKDDNSRLAGLSGIRLIKKLSEFTPCYCPILAFTASDKRRISEKAVEVGADGVWTKEGLDESRGIHREEYYAFSISRFKALLHQLRQLTGYEYRILYDCQKQINGLKSSPQQFWWQRTSWYLGDPVTHTPVDRTLISGQLEKLFLIHKQYLTTTQPAVKGMIYNMLTIKLCQMLDILHPLRSSANGNVLSFRQVLEQDWPPFSAAAAYAQFLLQERNAYIYLKSYPDEPECDPYRYRKTLMAFFEYLTLRHPAEASYKVVGTLRRHVDRRGEVHYGFTSDTVDGEFAAPEDTSACEMLLQGSDVRDSVEATLGKVPELLYNLEEVSPFRSDPEVWEQYWTASCRTLRTTPAGTLVSLFQISARKGFVFKLEGQAEMKRNDRIFFHVKLIDSGNAVFSMLANATLNPQESLRHTYWSAKVVRVFPTENGANLHLKDIEAPFNAVFRIPKPCMQELIDEKSTGRICFRPYWIQEWDLRNPVSVSDRDDTDYYGTSNFLKSVWH